MSIAWLFPEILDDECSNILLFLWMTKYSGNIYEFKNWAGIYYFIYEGYRNYSFYTDSTNSNDSNNLAFRNTFQNVREIYRI